MVCRLQRIVQISVEGQGQIYLKPVYSLKLERTFIHAPSLLIFGTMIAYAHGA